MTVRRESLGGAIWRFGFEFDPSGRGLEFEGPAILDSIDVFCDVYSCSGTSAGVDVFNLSFSADLVSMPSAIVLPLLAPKFLESEGKVEAEGEGEGLAS